MQTSDDILSFISRNDPDLFYLIWYQQEVNQFAVMDPQERFRIFAEMHGIDQVQHNWEESMEKLKEVQESLRTADINVANKQQWLGMAKVALERYENNRKRLVEGGRMYAGALLKLETLYKQEQQHLLAKQDLIILESNEGISQNKLSEEVGNDKAMSARTIKKLIELGYIYKKQHESNSKAYRIYLTAKAKDILPEIHEKKAAVE
ncbi:MarR family transcriptional regulator [Paenibacillus sp. FSL R7-0312]|uniref:MarR family transcriptional regulator n=1 Tax=Paenibacillus sp. FSL R7-0312 TaxID=2921682 RepID=UPI0030F53CB3